MTSPNLRRMMPSGASSGTTRRAGRSRLRVGRYGPRLLLRGALVAMALLVLVLLLVGCGNGELPAASPPPSGPATTPSPTATPTPSPTPAPTTTHPTPSPTRETTESPAPSDPGHGDGGQAGGSGRGPGTDARAGAPLWPAGDAARAQRMQEQADRGGDPWLLDPEEVTISYVGAELGYRNPSITRLGEGIYAVDDGRSADQVTVTLEQRVRTGPGGIWLVTNVDRA